jgi:hypothetical protein
MKTNEHSGGSTFRNYNDAKRVNILSGALGQASVAVIGSRSASSRIAGMSAGAAKVFFSYAHADAQHRDRLEKGLAMLKRQGLIETWHDRRIVPGQHVDDAISAELEAADLILLLVSQDFLASEYCYDVEMQRAMERHGRGDAHVIPIILRPSDWKSAPFGRLNALPTDGKPITKWTDPDDAFLDITEGIKRVIHARGATPRRRDVSTTAEVRTPCARSSNLRIARVFTEKDRDDFARNAFEFVARFFENSLEELSRRSPEVEGRFRRIDANRFTAVAYRGGRATARCTVFFGGLMGRGAEIGYSTNDSGATNSLNEALSVAEDEESLYLNPLGMSLTFGGQQRDQKLSEEGGAELLWALFVEPLQRRHG